MVANSKKNLSRNARLTRFSELRPTVVEQMIIAKKLGVLKLQKNSHHEVQKSLFQLGG